MIFSNTNLLVELLILELEWFAKEINDNGQFIYPMNYEQQLVLLTHFW